jgi:hypothetical protein
MLNGTKNIPEVEAEHWTPFEAVTHSLWRKDLDHANF